MITINIIQKELAEPKEVIRIVKKGIGQILARE
jgi:hypothetical protein